MMFWILIAVMTGAAALSVLIPLSRARPEAGANPVSADEAVYREQLSAIDGELKRGLIDAGAAEAARTEIARRLLAAHDNKREEAASGSRYRAKFAQGMALFVLPAAAFGFYLALGSPDQEDLPLAARLNAPAEEQSVGVLIARVERHLAEDPEDGQGWAVIAPVYMSIGQPQSSARAYANAIRILGPRPDWLTDMGEALTIANQGLVTAKAYEAFEKAVSLDPAAVKPRFFLALALGQEGRSGEAVKAWEALLDGADETASWVPAARKELGLLKDPGPAETPMSGPSSADIAASDEMSATDRQVMIKGMVASLAERLFTEGGSAQEWSRLIRAYMVLGEKQKAEQTLAEAQSAFSGKPEELSLIKDTASQLGLPET